MAQGAATGAARTAGASWEDPPPGGPTPGRRLVFIAALVAAAALGGLVLRAGEDAASPLTVDAREAAPRADADEAVAPADPTAARDTAGAVGAAAAAAVEVGSWRSMADFPLRPRWGASATWTGHRLVVWGGVDTTAWFDDGAAYDPTTDTWRRTSAAPIPARSGHVAVWTGAELLVWGGRDGRGPRLDGAAYDPGSDRWRRLAPAPRALDGASAAWTGRELFAWGLTDEGPLALRYDPSADRWREAAPSPWLASAADAEVVSADGQVLVWAGSHWRTDDRASAARYDPAADRWHAVAEPPAPGGFTASVAWTGERLLAWGRYQDRTSKRLQEAFVAYDPGTDSWERHSTPPLAWHVGTPLAWGGRRALAWTGGSGAVWRAASDRWLSLPAAPLERRDAHHAVWAAAPPGQVTTDLLLVWGGVDRDGNPLGDGAVWSPTAPSEPRALGTWHPLTDAPVAGRSGHGAVWTGAELVLWGGSATNQDRPFADGAALDPVTGAWRLLPAAPVAGRRDPLLVWTGGEVVVLGGRDERHRPLADAAAYDPRTDTWRRIADPPFAAGTAAWAGDRLMAAGAAVDDSRWLAATWTPGTDRWTPLPDPPERVTHAIWRGSEWVVAWPGRTGPQLSSLGPNDTEWRPLPTFPLRRSGIGFQLARTRSGLLLMTAHGDWAVLPSGRAAWSRPGERLPVGDAALVSGTQQLLAVGRPGPRVAVLEPASARWRLLTDPPLGRRDGFSATWAGDRLVLWGGSGRDGPAADGALWQPADLAP